MSLTLITVNYQNTEATIDLLRSLEKQTSKEFDVIVVDNDSAPEKREALGEYAMASPLHLDIIYSDTNRGFSGGNNLAIRKALAQGSEWLLLINNDTTVETDFIAQLPHEKGLVGVPLKEGDAIVYGGAVRWLRSTLKHINQPEKNSYVIGAGMLIHKTVLEKAGLLDERYFLYFEDVDFSMQVHKAGLLVTFTDKPLINHAVSQSTSRLGSSLLLRYHARNSLLFNSKNGPWWVRVLLPFWAISRILYQSFKTVFVPSSRPYARAIRAGILDFYAKRFGQIDH